MILRRLSHSRLCEESGHVLLYALGVLPFVLTLSILAVDLSGWQRLRQEAQQVSDRLALQAAQQLPDQNRTLGFIAESVASFGGRFQLASVEVNEQQVRLALAGGYESFFDMFLSQAGGERVFSVYHESAAGIVPGDYVVVVADGQTLRPNATLLGDGTAQLEEPWGDPGSWPQSGYFSCVTSPSINNPSAPWRWWEQWNDTGFRRWLTQACYNPVFSNLKLAAIQVVDALASVATNRVGALLSPGTGGPLGYSVLRHIRGEVRDSSGAIYFPGAIGGFIQVGVPSVESHWLNYFEQEAHLGDEACILFAQSEWDNRYPLIESAGGYGFPHPPSSCSEPVQFPPCGAPHLPVGHLDGCYLQSSLPLREAIYYTAAKHYYGPSSAEPDILAAVEQALVQLLDVPNQELLEQEAAIRGNLGYQQLRKVIVLTDTLPPAAPGGTIGDPRLNDIISILQASGAQLLVAGLFHEGLSVAEREELAGAMTALENVAAALPESGTLQLFRAVSPDDLRERVAPLLVRAGREVALQQ